MADVEPGEMPTTDPAGEMPAEQPSTETPAGESLDAIKAELEQARKALKDANREAADRRKKLEAFEQAEKQRKDAELSEMERLQKQLDELKAERDRAAAELKQRQIDDTKRAIAAKLGLPEALALRIQGDDEEAMEADAKAMLAALPKQPAQPRPNPTVNPTNPGGAQGGETDAQKRERIFGSPNRDFFKPESAQQRGGGVIWRTKPNDTLSQ
jgi:multidrug efflux pump subunit AcrB